MSGEMTLLGFAAMLTRAVAHIPRAQADVMEKAALVIEKEAKRVLGTYDYGWAPLSPITVARKAKGDTPGLETGGMRDSVQHGSTKDELRVGSNDDKAVWFELGTSRGQPPRPFLSGALAEKLPEVEEIIGGLVAHALHLAGH